MQLTTLYLQLLMLNYLILKTIILLHKILRQLSQVQVNFEIG